jgi:hypothetical protein
MCVSKLSELSHQQQITLRMRGILILGGRSDFAGVVLDEFAPSKANVHLALLCPTRQ